MVVLAVDGGNSKTDVALVADDGALLAAVRGPTVSHQAVGLDEGMARLERLARDIGASDEGPADVGVFALAGADYPATCACCGAGSSGLASRARSSWSTTRWRPSVPGAAGPGGSP